MADIEYMIRTEMDSRERRFIAAAFRKGALESSLVKGLALATAASWSIAFIAVVDASNSMETRLWCLLGTTCLLAMAIATWICWSRKRRTTLLALDRCGCCAHKLCGNKQVIQSNIHAKTCSECGTVWTDLDRRDSLSVLYGCA